MNSASPPPPAFAELSIEQSELSWQTVKEFLQEFQNLILIVFVLVVGCTYGVLQLYTEKYDTEASILVKLGRETVDPPAVVQNTSVFTSGLRREEVVGEMEYLKSPYLLREVVERMGPEAFRTKLVKPDDLLGQGKYYLKVTARFAKKQFKEALILAGLQKRLTDFEGAVLEVAGSLSASNPKDTDVITLKLRMASPELSQRILAELISVYSIHRIQVHKTRGVDEFLQKAAAEKKLALEATEELRKDFKSKAGLSVPREQKSSLLMQLQDITTEYDRSRRDIAAARQQISELDRLLASTPQNIQQGEQTLPNPVQDSLAQKLSTLETDRAQLLGKYSEQSTTVRNLDAEIRRVRELLEREKPMRLGAVSTQVNPLWQTLTQRRQEATVALAGLESKVGLQQRHVDNIGSQLRQIDSADQRLEVIERERQLAESSYLEISKRRQASEISQQLDESRISNISVLSPPLSTIEPVYPRRLLIMGVSIFVGLMLGVGLSMLLVYMDNTVRSAERLEIALGVPHLGTIQLEPTTKGNG